MYVTLTLDDVDTVQDHGSVVVITGTGENGERVTFAGDHRPMADVLGALVTDQEDEITVDVEDWQVRRVEHATARSTEHISEAEWTRLTHGEGRD